MINLSSDALILVDLETLAASVNDSVTHTSSILPAVKKLSVHPFKTFIASRVIHVDDVENFIDVIVRICVTERRDHESYGELRDLLGIKRIPSKYEASRLKSALRFLLTHLHKSGVLVLPYKFKRPAAGWVNELDYSDSCYSEVVTAIRKLDTIPWSGPTTGEKYSPEEKANRRLFSMGTKLALASSWVAPEDITLEDILQWRAVGAKFRTLDDNTPISPPAVMQLIEYLKLIFNNRIGFEIFDLESEVKKTRGAIPQKAESFFAMLLKESESAEKLISNFDKQNLAVSSSFFYDAIERYDVVGGFSMLGVDIYAAYDLWLSLQNKFMVHMGYVSQKTWKTLLGRFNIYLLVYLPFWFYKHAGTRIKFPAAPQLFVGPLFYESAQPKSDDLPFTFTDFLKWCGFPYTGATATNMRLYFDFLIKIQSTIYNGEKIANPVVIIPAYEGPNKTTKISLSRKIEVVYSKYLAAIQGMEPAINLAMPEIKKQIARTLSKSPYVDYVLDLASMGVEGAVELDGRKISIFEIDLRALMLFHLEDRTVLNPVSYVFPFCLVRGGFRGQSLQWLDEFTYDQYSDLDYRGEFGLDILWMNTDKNKKLPFPVYIRPSVMNMLDIQKRWKQDMIDNGAVGLRQQRWYDNKIGVKWGKINCLFASHNNGLPITDGEYEVMWRFSQLSFQAWLKKNRLFNDDNDLVAYFPVKKNNSAFGGSSTTERRAESLKYFTWDEVKSKNLPMESVKIIEVLHSDGACEFVPINLRPKHTPHAGRATHITLLMEHSDPETVALTTGQKVRQTEYYNRGEKSIMDRLAGVINRQDNAWELVQSETPFLKSKEIAELITGAKDNATAETIVRELSLASPPHPDDWKSNDDGVALIAELRSQNLGVASTHLCTKGFVCPREIIVKLGGERRCSWCPFSVWSVHLIHEVSAHRHFLGEELERVNRELNAYRTSVGFSPEQAEILALDLKRMAEDVMGWYIVERSLDLTVRQKRKLIANGSYVLRDKDAVLDQVNRYVTKTDSLEAFVARLEQCVEFPLSRSVDFRNKIARATRFLLSGQGDVYQAIRVNASVSSEVRLAALLRERMAREDIDVNRFLEFVSMTDDEWYDAIAKYRESIDVYPAVSSGFLNDAE